MSASATDQSRIAGSAFDAAALAQAWRDFGSHPEDRRAKLFLARALSDEPNLLGAESLAKYLDLLNDCDVEPDPLCPAGWEFLLRNTALFAEQDPELLASRLENHALANTLLAAAPVTTYSVEKQLTRVRRWLFVSGRWPEFPKLVKSLRSQTALNEGAWLIEDDECALLNARPDDESASLYFAGVQGTIARTDLADPVTRAVAEQYESWPYPQWMRVQVPPPKRIDVQLREWDPAGPDTIPQRAEVLIAGCGSGRQVASFAVRYPDVRITAIDVSEASLRCAQQRCAEMGLSGIEFLHFDIHRLSDLNRSFDVISCTGVLHHLPVPEAGWAALADVLKPHGAMHIMVYSKLARLTVRGLRQSLGDLLEQPRDAQLLRQIRRRIIERFPDRVPGSRDFYNLTGVHDLLANRHEDPFDVSRIKRAIDKYGLRLLHFRISPAAVREQYRREFPHDPEFRDFQSWSAFERKNVRVFARMYDFWCRKC